MHSDRPAPFLRPTRRGLRYPYAPGAILGAVLGVALFAASGCERSPGKPAEKTALPAPSASGAAASPASAAAASDTAPKARPGHLLGRDSARDIQSLLDTAIARIRRRDTVGLVRLMVDDSAWRLHLWPVSNAYDPKSEDAFQFVLAMHKANSAKGLRRVLADAVKPDSTPATFLRVLEDESLPGATLYHVMPGDGVRPFGSALCAGSACRIATFAQPGARSRGRGP